MPAVACGSRDSAGATVEGAGAGGSPVTWSAPWSHNSSGAPLASKVSQCRPGEIEADAWVRFVSPAAVDARCAIAGASVKLMDVSAPANNVMTGRRTRTLPEDRSHSNGARE